MVPAGNAILSSLLSCKYTILNDKILRHGQSADFSDLAQYLFFCAYIKFSKSLEIFVSIVR